MAQESGEDWFESDGTLGAEKATKMQINRRGKLGEA